MVRQRTPRRVRACYVDGTDNSRDGFHPLGVLFLKCLNRDVELLGRSVVIRPAILTPCAGGSASKIDPQSVGLLRCLLWTEAGGRGCWSWRRLRGYGASTLSRA